MTAKPLPVLRSSNIHQRAGKLLAGLAVLAGATYVILRSGGATRMNFDRAVFTIFNTLTLSGFQLPVNPADLNWTGQLAIFALMCGSVLTWLIVGGWALVRVLRMTISDDEVVYATVLIFSLCVVVGATVLIDRNKPIGPAVFEAAGAFGNFGLTLQRPAPATDWRVHVVILPLAIIGAMGIPVVLDLARSILHWRRPHPHSSATLASLALVYLLGFGALFFVELSNGRSAQAAGVIASAESIDARTLGSTSGAINSLARGSQWIVLLLMAVGACAGGAGGGIKSTTLYVLIRDAAGLIAGRAAGRMLGIACMVVVSWALIASATMLLLVEVEPQLSFERALFIAVSAVSNVGLSHEPLSLGAASMHALSAAMLLGRSVPLMLLCWAAQKDVQADIAAG